MKTFVSILRYTPNPLRGEWLNIGVLVVSPAHQYFEYVIPRGQIGRLRCLDPAFDRQRIERAEAALARAKSYFYEELACDIYSQGDGHTVVDEDSSLAERILPFITGRYVAPSPLQEVQFQSEPHGAATLTNLLRQTLEEEVLWRTFTDASSSSEEHPSLLNQVLQMFEGMGFYTPHSSYSRLRRNYRPAVADVTFDFGYRNEQNKGVEHLIELADVPDIENEDSALRAIGPVLAKHLRMKALEERDPTYQAKRFTIVSGQRKIGKALAPSIHLLQSCSQVYFSGEENDMKQLANRMRAVLT